MTKKYLTLAVAALTVSAFGTSAHAGQHQLGNNDDNNYKRTAVVKTFKSKHREAHYSGNNEEGVYQYTTQENEPGKFVKSSKSRKHAANHNYNQ